MNIENIMDEFEKVADKKPVEDVAERMKDFERVDKNLACEEDKQSTLPYGLKRYKTCPKCGEFMEIYEIEEEEAVYRCPNCEGEYSFRIEE